MTNIWDPNNWDLSVQTNRIYGDENLLTFHELDDVDYWYFSRWRWRPKYSRSKVGKYYLHRAMAVWVDSVKIKTISVYLHVEIMKRCGVEPLTPMHRLADHRDGNSLNCRRANLRWATSSMNRLNIHGSYPYDLVDS